MSIHQLLTSAQINDKTTHPLLPRRSDNPAAARADSVGVDTGVSDFLHASLAAFATLDQHAIENFIRSYGTQAAVVSFFLMILQAIVAPLPAFVITFANASLFGAFWGGILSRAAQWQARRCAFLLPAF